MTLSKFALAALSAALLLAAPARSATIDFVTNGSFEATSLTDKGYFADQATAASNVTGWSIGYYKSLTFLDFPGTADNANKYLTVYGPFPTTSPVGGNFIEADGDPAYSSAISQTLNGLTPGQRYDVTFYQAAGQQAGFKGPTTERWQVSLGGSSQLSSLFSLPEGGVGSWQKQTLTFQATAVSQVLSFLAVGTPNGAPPISFLDGVSVTATVPEPMTLSVLGAGLLGTFALRRRAKAAA